MRTRSRRRPCFDSRKFSHVNARQRRERERETETQIDTCFSLPMPNAAPSTSTPFRERRRCSRLTEIHPAYLLVSLRATISPIVHFRQLSNDRHSHFSSNAAAAADMPASARSVSANEERHVFLAIAVVVRLFCHPSVRLITSCLLCSISLSLSSV